MAKKQKGMTDDLLKAIKESGRSLYGIAKDADVDLSALARFVRRDADLSMKNASKIALALGLELRPKG